MRQEALFRDKNFLYSGDNLDILRFRIASDSVDLVYLDPPFNSNQNYNVLFKERGGTGTTAQIKAFGDTWRWDRSAAESYRDAIENGPEQLGNAMQAFRTLLGTSDILAYLSMMAPRLVELHRVLKDSGSLYLHCDPTASHYLKLLMDAIFGPGNFRNEIIWKRTTAHNSAQRYGPVHDVILFYSKSESFTWNQQYQAYSEKYIASKYRYVDEATGKLYRVSDLTGPGVRKGPSGQPWRGYDPTSAGRHWQQPSYCYDKYREMTGEDLAQYALLERLERLDEIGLIHWPKSKNGRPEHKRFLDDMPGVGLQDVWTDVDAINARAAERLGYPTQKPLPLLERIIRASSNEGDTILDPFCGCGTSIDAAQTLSRRWVGIDITQVAIDVVRSRLRTEFGDEIEDTYSLIRNPASVDDALALAKDDKYQFQWWVLDRLGASDAPRKKGRDKGVDGRLNFYDDPTQPPKRIVISVKGGSTGPGHVRDLRGVMERDKATIGVFVTVKEPTHQMRVEALTAGVYHSDEWNRDYERLQFITVEDLIAGNHIDYPSGEWHTASGFRPKTGTAKPASKKVKAPTAPSDSD